MNCLASNFRIETPKRRVFYSFHYGNDCWRTQQIRNIGALDGNKPVSANDWETLKRVLKHYWRISFWKNIVA